MASLERAPTPAYQTAAHLALLTVAGLAKAGGVSAGAGNRDCTYSSTSACVCALTACVYGEGGEENMSVWPLALWYTQYVPRDRKRHGGMGYTPNSISGVCRSIPFDNLKAPSCTHI